MTIIKTILLILGMFILGTIVCLAIKMNQYNQDKEDSLFFERGNELVQCTKDKEQLFQSACEAINAFDLLRESNQEPFNIRMEGVRAKAEWTTKPWLERCGETKGPIPIPAIDMNLYPHVVEVLEVKNNQEK